MFGFKKYNYDSFTKEQLMKDMAAHQFGSGPEPGEKAPEFEARTLDGDKVRLGDFAGEKNVVLTFGSATCPMTAGSISGINELYEEYNGDDVQFLFCYVREAHPGERIPAHLSMSDKTRAAEILQREEEIEIPVIVDDLKGSIHRSYGKMPNSTYIIDKSGRVAFRALWTRPRVIEEALDELLEVQQERDTEHAIVGGGEDTTMPKSYAVLHSYRALERGGRRAMRDFHQELGMPGRVAVTASRIMEPITLNPGIALGAAALAGVAIVGGLLAGKKLRTRRLQMREPYRIQEGAGRRPSSRGGDYEAVGI
jgi:alkyl hydroperoxide reductase subunit AhpC